MKTNPWNCLAIGVVTALLALTAGAGETAIVKGNSVNVRAQPSMFSEVVTQLKEGDKVVVLEEITLKKPKLEEPTEWVRIQMPINTPIWVSSLFVDSESHTVTARRLNARAGPGENYSVVGLLQQGDKIKPIRTVETWYEIESDTNAYAFVASELLTKVPEAQEEKPTPVEAPPQEKPAPVVDNLRPDPPIILPQETAPTNAPAQRELVAPPPVLANPPNIEIMPPPVAKPLPKIEEPPPRRIVQREGVVRGAVSIQAPTYYELNSPETGKLINYLHSSNTNIVLKKYRGQKVLLTGEEFMDVRWKYTPVLEVKTLKLAPDATP